MRLDFGSDLHLYHGGYDYLKNISNEGSDVLVLAGDIVEVCDLKGYGKYAIDVRDYLLTLNSRYKKIIFVAGNHEHWGNSFYHTTQNLRSRFSEFGLTNFVVLDKETVEVDDAIFFGATLWSTLRNGNPVAVASLLGFSDYREIHTISDYYEKLPLQPEHTMAECARTIKALDKFIALETDKKKIMVTHHAPCSVSLDPSYVGGWSEAYYEELGNKLYDSDIKIAIHGHIHQAVNYMIGECHVMSNPRGYFGYEAQTPHFRFKQVEV